MKPATQFVAIGFRGGYITRKRFVKILIGYGYSRDEANKYATKVLCLYGAYKEGIHHIDLPPVPPV